ncbi:MAG: ABC transporter ATP-binding protein [Pyrinomonadaceae bacterium]
MTKQDTEVLTASDLPGAKAPLTLWKALRRTFAFSKPYRFRLYTALFLTHLASLVTLSLPLGLRELLNAVSSQNSRALLNQTALVLLLLFLLRAVISFLGIYQLEWVGERVVSDLREKVYTQLHRLSLRFFANHRLGDITSRLTNDVTALRPAVTTSLAELLGQGVTVLGAIALMVVLNWRLSLVIFFSVPVAAICARSFGKHVRKLSRQFQEQLANTTVAAEEAISAVRIVKAFAREPYEVSRYTQAVEELFAVGRRRSLISGLFAALVGLIFSSMLSLLFWYGGSEMLAGRLTTGDLVAFLFYTFIITRSIGTLTGLYATFNSAAGASERLFELLDTEPEIQDAPLASDLRPVQGNVAFENVSFTYEQKNLVLENLSFAVRPGETVAIIGPSGAGKTTLLHLIPRLFEPTSGRITIDGQDIQQVTLKSLREQVGIVPQDVHLFSCSVRENIRYGRLDATDEEVETAARIANADEFIAALPDGCDTQVGEKGVKLSGGQRQRIAIARALLKSPQILLLDEATSSLDTTSEALVQEAMERLAWNRTTFVVAHRLSTVQNSTRILVLDHGRVVQSGTHEELIKDGGLYRQLYDVRFRGAVELVSQAR